MNKTIFCEISPFGLGDRLLDILGLRVIMKLLNIDEAMISWRNDMGRYCNRELIDFISLNMRICQKENVQNKNNIHRTICSVTLSPYNIWMLKPSVGINEIIQLYIETAKDIEKCLQIDRLVPDYINNCIGIHMRRTDKILQSPQSTHEMNYEEYHIMHERLLKHITKLIKDQSKEQSLHFYLCSDDLPYKQILANKIKNIALENEKEIIIHKTDPHIFQENQSEYDLYEMLCLFKCKEILQGTKYSTYSTFASLMSQKPIYNFSDHASISSMYAWKPCLNLFLSDGDNIVQYDHDINIAEMKQSVADTWGDIKLVPANIYSVSPSS